MSAFPQNNAGHLWTRKKRQRTESSFCKVLCRMRNASERYWWRSKRHLVPVHALWKHAVRRKTWFRGTISFWCWANIQSYLQMVRTDSSPDIDFSAQTLDKQSLCDLQITPKEKTNKQHMTHDGLMSSVSTGIKKKTDVDVCTFCTVFF